MSKTVGEPGTAINSAEKNSVYDYDPIVTIRNRRRETQTVPLSAHDRTYRARGWRAIIEPNTLQVHENVLLAALEDADDQAAFLAARSDAEIETWATDVYTSWAFDALVAEYRRRVLGELQRRYNNWMAAYGEKWPDRAQAIWAAGHASANALLFASIERDPATEFDLIAAALRETRAHS